MNDPADQAIPEVYDELRALAERWFRRQAPGQTLQPTALVHEAYLKLAGHDAPFESRDHFAAVAARAMRQILIDRARRARTKKHGGDAAHISVDDALVAGKSSDVVDVIALDEALGQLEALDARKGRVAELKLFAGMTDAEIAGAIDAARSTVAEDWRFARAWLARSLSGDSKPSS